MTRAFLGLGSNLGDRRAHLRRALAAMAADPQVELVAVSGLYETEPLGGPDQDPYLNLVAEVEVPAPGGAVSTARGLLALAQHLETVAGRVREQRWGPRTLDVDVLWVDGETVEDADLVVPHPRMAERRFVLAPLAELAPEVVIGIASADWERRARGEVSRVGGPELVRFPPGGRSGPPGPRRPPTPGP